jgi:hypothetical protein
MTSISIAATSVNRCREEAADTMPAPARTKDIAAAGLTAMKIAGMLANGWSPPDHPERPDIPIAIASTPLQKASRLRKIAFPAVRAATRPDEVAPISYALFWHGSSMPCRPTGKFTLRFS